MNGGWTKILEDLFQHFDGRPTMDPSKRSRMTATCFQESRDLGFLSSAGALPEGAAVTKAMGGIRDGCQRAASSSLSNVVKNNAINKAHDWQRCIKNQ